MLKNLQIIGNLVRDAEVFTPNNSMNRSVINFLVAVNDKQRDGSNKTLYVDCSYWRENGKTSVSELMTKGSLVYVHGEPSVSCYTDKNGKAVPKLKVDAKRVDVLNRKIADKEIAEKGSNVDE